MTDTRKGNWMQTISGRAYWPLDPSPDDVHIGDIAHALGNMCRYGGHCKRFYSVAEHCVHVSYMVPAEHALVGLLHDATEAYVVDVPRPLKKDLVGYKALEALNWRAIAARFGVPETMPDAVEQADGDILFSEQAELLHMPAPLPGWGFGHVDRGVRIAIPGWEPTEARRRFLLRFDELYPASS